MIILIQRVKLVLLSLLQALQNHQKVVHKQVVVHLNQQLLSQAQVRQ